MRMRIRTPGDSVVGAQNSASSLAGVERVGGLEERGLIYRLFEEKRDDDDDDDDDDGSSSSSTRSSPSPTPPPPPAAPTMPTPPNPTTLSRSTSSSVTSTRTTTITSTSTTSQQTITTSTNTSKSNSQTTSTQTISITSSIANINDVNAANTSTNTSAPTISPFLDSQGDVTSHHMSYSTAVAVAIALSVTLTVLGIAAFIVKRALGRQKLRDRWPGEKLGFNGGGNGRVITYVARRPESTVRSSMVGSERSGSGSSGWRWGDEGSEREFSTPESGGVIGGLGVRPQTRYISEDPRVGMRGNGGRSMDSGLARSDYIVQDPFADQQEFGGGATYTEREHQGPVEKSSERLDLQDYIAPTTQNAIPGEFGTMGKNAMGGGEMYTRYVDNSESDWSARKVADLEEGGNEDRVVVTGTNSDVYEDPFTAGNRGTKVWMGSSEEERREGRWRNARSWVMGQVERVTAKPPGEH